MRLVLVALLLTGCTSSIAQRTDQLLTRYQMYGFTGRVLVAEHERLVLDRGYGIRERAFDAGSIMKTIVAAAVVRLQSEGRLNVHDPVDKYIEGWPDITIEQLLMHTSGLPLDDANAPRVGRPGERYSYSNAGYGLLADIVERASGEPFRAYARRTLLEPARMRETSFWGEPSPPMPLSYAGNSDEELEPVEPLRHTDAAPRRAGKYVFGAVGLITTTRDLLRWRQYVERHRELQTYGWNVTPEKTYRGGFIQGSVMTMLAAYPQNETVLAWLINKNTGWHEPLTASFERILRGESYVVPPRVVRGRDAVASTFSNADARIVITRDGDDLLVAAEGQPLLSMLWQLAPNELPSPPDTTCTNLGTARHPSAKSRLQTFIRCGDVITRHIIENDRVIAKGDGYPKSAQRRFRRVGRGRYAMYDHNRDYVVLMDVDTNAVSVYPAPTARDQRIHRQTLTATAARWHR